MPSKPDLRRAQRLRLRALPPEARALHSAALRHVLRQHPRLRHASRIAAFLPLPDEPDLLPLLREWLSEGRNIAIPFLPNSGTWHFHWVQALEPLLPGPWGIPLPPIGLPAPSLDAILVPGLAFTPTGDRLGRGKGIYDRLLASTPAFTLGCGFPEHLLPSLPREPHDHPLDQVLCQPPP